MQIDDVFKAIDLRDWTHVGMHSWPEAAVRLPEAGYIKRDRSEIKDAGWVRPREHPDGWLCRHCDVYGHEYGLSWLFEEVPPAALAFLSGLPNAPEAFIR